MQRTFSLCTAGLLLLSLVVLPTAALEQTGHELDVMEKTKDMQVSWEQAKPLDMTVTKTSYSGPGSQIAQAGVKFLIGFIIVGFAFPVLWFNERRQAKMWALFGKAQSIAVRNCSADKINTENEAKLVHVQGETSTSESLKDQDSGITVSNCVKLQREVNMYQWVEKRQEEERDTMMGGKEKVVTYSYEQEWMPFHVDSTQFEEAGHDNPPMPVLTETLQVIDLHLGSFRLPKRLAAKLCNFSKLTQAEQPESISVKGKHLQLRDGTYTTEDMSGPRIGDLEIKYQKVQCGPTTAVAIQNHQSLAPLTYTMTVENGRVVEAGGKGGNKPLLAEDKLNSAAEGTELDLEADGCCAVCGLLGNAIEANEEVFEIVPSHESFGTVLKGAAESQSSMHLILQVVGFLMLLVGFDCIFTFVPTFFRIIPFIGTWIQLFGNIIAHVAALLFATVFWCVVVAVAWFSMRPLKASILLTVALLVFVVPTVLAGQEPATAVPVDPTVTAAPAVVATTLAAAVASAATTLQAGVAAVTAAATTVAPALVPH